MEKKAIDFNILLGKSGGLPVLETVDEYRADPETVESCARWLAKHGVTAYATQFGLACSAPRETIETLFQTSLTTEKDARPSFPAHDFASPPRIPDTFPAETAEITISVEPEFF